MSLFNISIITATAPSIGNEWYKFTISKEVCISLENIFYSFASSANEDEFKALSLFLFKVGCIILTKYFEVPYRDDPIVDTTALIGYFFSGLCAFNVPYNLGDIQSNG